MWKAVNNAWPVESAKYAAIILSSSFLLLITFPHRVIVWIKSVPICKVLPASPSV